MPKAIDAVESPTTGPLKPVPERVTTWGLSVALSEIVSVPEREPAAPGSKVTLIVHDELAPTLEPQLSVSLKSLASVPPNEMLLMVSSVLWLLLRMTGCEALGVPTPCVPKLRDDGVAATPPHPGILKFETRVFQTGLPLPVWLDVKYSFAYQKVQPFVGSTLMSV